MESKKKVSRSAGLMSSHLVPSVSHTFSLKPLTRKRCGCPNVMDEELRLSIQKLARKWDLGTGWALLRRWVVRGSLAGEGILAGKRRAFLRMSCRGQHICHPREGSKGEGKTDGDRDGINNWWVQSKSRQGHEVGSGEIFRVTGS